VLELLAHELVLRHAATRRDRAAIVAGDRAITYGELAHRIAAIATGLQGRGVRKGDRVVVLIPMSPELYLVLLAIAAIGATAVFVEPKSTLSEIARAVRIARPRAFVAIPRAHALRAAFRDVGRVPLAVLVGPRLLARAAGAVALEDLEIEHDGAALPAVPMTADDPVLLTFSSGSTGAPKAATRSHAFLAAQHAAIERLVDRRSWRRSGRRSGRDPGRDDVDMSAFAIVVLSSLCAGVTAVLPPLGRGGVDDVDGAALVRVIDERGVSVLSGSPAFLAPIFDAARGRHLFGVRRVVSGGAPVPVAMCEAADEVLLPKGRFLVAYGSTEAEPIATIEASEVRSDTAAATRAGRGLCVGRPDPEIRLRLLAPAGGPLAIGPEGIDGLSVRDGEVGEVTVSGPHVNQTYYRNPAAVRATKVVDETGTVWHRTGDAGYLDGDGRLWIVGRIADTVRRGDRDYYPAAVEALAQELPGVERAALVADRAGGARLVVQAARGARGARDSRRIADHLAAAGVPVDAVAFARALPVDPRHRAKLDYRSIREEHSA
jgi:acyl-CoA synthetase (AMP-forming)/AMP-acid ligase II